MAVNESQGSTEQVENAQAVVTSTVADGAGRAPSPMANVSRETLTVLIAEDDPLVCQVLSLMIDSDPGMRLIGTVADAHGAIVTAIDEHPDLLLLDVEMPGGGGPAAARTISTVCPDIRVVAISAHSDKEHVLSMVNEGVAGYVVKGAEPAQMLDTIRRCARGETVFMPPSASTMMRENAVLARDMVTAEVERHARIARMHEICETNAIEIVYQPIANLISGKLTAVEALARFPDHDQLNTGEWFEEAFELGMTQHLELTALRAAIASFGARKDEDLSIAINLSPATLLDPQLSLMIEGFETRLIIEITEHQPIDDYGAVNNVRQELGERGVRIAIDDTGAGFASLRHILSLSPDLVKLDISITKDVDEDDSRRALAKGLVTFAREIGAKVVAEGIERRGELACMREIGADYGQGWHIARPSLVDALPRLETRLV
jgi:EAL domain-containing protein (putative c-di-GMP-specific phosphodiesterase class I)/DNA-binding NarL/FixJ family response regulator